MMKNTKWTELELVIVYYIAKWGTYGAVKGLDRIGVLHLVDHSINSIQHTIGKFQRLLGIKVVDAEGTFDWNPSKLQKQVVKDLENKTISQVRELISIGLEARNQESDTSIPDDDNSRIDERGESEGEQLTFNF